MPVASEVMDRAASFLNDMMLTNYTYSVQIPYLNVALDDLRQAYENNDIPLVNKTDTTITVNAGVLTIGGGGGDPSLPLDLIEIQTLYERLAGTENDFIEMIKREFLPGYVIQTEALVYWTWQNEVVRFIGATTDRDIRIDYIANPITKIEAETDNIKIKNSLMFLSYRTAALCAEFIGENPTRAASLNANAGVALDTLLSNITKRKQAMAIRRRPFRASYKLRTGMN